MLASSCFCWLQNPQPSLHRTAVYRFPLGSHKEDDAGGSYLPLLHGFDDVVVVVLFNGLTCSLESDWSANDPYDHRISDSLQGMGK